MSHVSPSHSARATDHAVRRYAERVLELDLGGEDVPDQVALARAQAVNCTWVRCRLAQVEGIILAAGMRKGWVVEPLEGMNVRVAGGAVVTIVRPPMRTPRRRAPAGRVTLRGPRMDKSPRGH